MARTHKGMVIVGCMIVGGAIIAAPIVGNLGGGLWNFAFGKEEEPPVVASAPFQVEVGEEPAKPVEKKEPKPQPERHIPLSEKPTVVATKANNTQKPPSYTDKWIAGVMSGGMYAFGKENGYSGTGSSDGECQITQPVRVRAQIADSATTDDPGMAIGMVSEDVQGRNSNREWCTAIPAMAVVSFHVDKAGDYATNRAPVKVGEIWMEDGFKVTVDQPAKYVDGSIGVIGKANHHVVSKTFAAIIGGAFRLLDNATSIAQYNVSSSDATDPFEDMVRKRTSQPSTISFTGSKVVEFDVMPVSTPGYDERR